MDFVRFDCQNSFEIFCYFFFGAPFLNEVILPNSMDRLDWTLRSSSTWLIQFGWKSKLLKYLTSRKSSFLQWDLIAPNILHWEENPHHSNERSEEKFLLVYKNADIDDLLENTNWQSVFVRWPPNNYDWRICTIVDNRYQISNSCHS